MLIKLDSIVKAEESNFTGKPGVYTVKIVKVEDKTSQSGNNYVRITYETIGENVFTVKANYFPESEKALSILLNVLSAIGLYDKEHPTELNVSNDYMLGNILQIEFVLGEPDDNGKQYLEVKPWSAKPSVEELPF